VIKLTRGGGCETEYRRGLHATLDLLDEGFALYRRSFTSFVLVGLAWLTPIAIATGLLIANAERLGPGWFIVIFLAGLILMLPLLIYLIGGLSRAANAAIEGRPINLHEALALHPGVVAKAGCFYRYLRYSDAVRVIFTGHCVHLSALCYGRDRFGNAGCSTG
jgi:hypothetical protein